MTETLLLGTFFLALCGADLSAPVVPSQPTIGSEIRRGADAATACERVDVVVETQLYMDCVDAAHNDNRQRMGSGYDAFDTGLYFVERRKLQILLGAAAKSSILDPGMIRAAFDLADANYRLARDHVGVTDDQVELARYSP
jgi:hypothetical protein